MIVFLFQHCGTEACTVPTHSRHPKLCLPPLYSILYCFCPASRGSMWAAVTVLVAAWRLRGAYTFLWYDLSVLENDKYNNLSAVFSSTRCCVFFSVFCLLTVKSSTKTVTRNTVLHQNCNTYHGVTEASSRAVIRNTCNTCNTAGGRSPHLHLINRHTLFGPCFFSVLRYLVSSYRSPIKYY